jgi:hypothetical protein
MRFGPPLAFVVSLVVPIVAWGQDDDQHRPDLFVPAGFSLSVGGGLSTFAREDLRAVADVAGSWDARFAVGTRQPIAFELAYLGSVQNVDALGLDEDAVLISSGAETAIRFNLLVRMWQPYLVAGAAWRRYEVTNAAVNTSDIGDRYDVLEAPIGLGVGFRYEGLLVDGRATYRAAYGDDIGDEDLHTLGCNLTVGLEF